MKVLYFLILFMGSVLCASLHAFSQTAKIDSLLFALKNVKKDTSKVKLLNKLSAAFFNIDSNKTLNYAEQAKALAEQLNYSKGLASAYVNIGRVYAARSNYSPALDYFDKSLKIYRKLLDKENIGDVLNKVGAIYYSQGNYSLAFKYYSESLRQNEELKDVKGTADALNDIGVLYDEQGDYTLALSYYFRAIKYYEKINHVHGVVSVMGNIGIVYYNLGQYSFAQEYYFKTLKICESDNTIDKSVPANALCNIGIMHNEQGNYSASLEYYLKALKLYEQIGDKDGIASILNKIGDTYAKQNKYADALKYYVKALDICEKTENKKGTASSLVSIGNIHLIQKSYPLALYCFSRSLALFEEMRNKQGVSTAFSNIGHVYSAQEKYEEALSYFFKALKMAEEINNKSDVVTRIINIGRTFLIQGKYSEVIQYTTKGLNIAKEIGVKEGIKNASEILSKAYFQLGNYKMAFLCLKDYSSIKDTLLNAESSKNIARMQTIYETEKKDKEIQLLSKDKEIQSANLKKQRIINYSVSAGLLLVIVLVFFIYRSYLQKQKANLALTAAYKEIEGKNKIVEEKNKDITDSIIYAKRIQQAILPPTDVIQKALPQSFILYTPKDIVSGDFYWFNKINENEILLAVVDCTGHGVPGAFMSMIGYDHLHSIVNEQRITDTSKILDEMHKRILFALNRDIAHQESKDGMDVAILKIDKNKREIQFSGAVRPLYYFDSNRFHEVKGERWSIGGVKKIDEEPYVSTSISIKETTTVYIFTDGFADQFGGSEGKKFTSKRLKELLFSIQDKSMQEQKEILTKTFSEWQGELGQVDDVLVIGIKI